MVQSSGQPSLPPELTKLLDLVPDATLVVDEDGSILEASSQVEELFGYEPGELRGRRVEVLMPERLRAGHGHHRADFHADPRTRPMGEGRDLLGLRKDGYEVPVEISLSPLEVDGATLVVSSIRDASQRRERERSLRESERQLEEAQRIGHIGSWRWVPADQRVDWSAELYRIFGYEPGAFEPSFEGYMAAIHPADRDAVAATVEETLAGGTYEIDHRIVRPDGTVRMLHCHGEAVLVDGVAECMVGTAQDVTEMRRAESELARLSQQKAAILEAAGEGIVGVDPAGTVTFVNSAAAKMLGASVESLVGGELGEVVHGPEGAHEALLAPSTGEDVFRGAEGKRFPVEYVVSELPSSEGEAPGCVVSFSDITERRRTEAQLQYLADHDALTGLFNRRRFEEELERELARVTRSGGTAALLVLDLDNFKDVNDSLGHTAGDSLVRGVAEALVRRLRRTDVVARLGGDEIAILLPDTDEAGARQTARALQEAVRSQSVVVDGRRARITTSIGIAMVSGGDGRSPEELMVGADLAMYEAKDAGRDRYTVFRPGESRAHIGERLTLVDRLRTAIDRGRLVLYGQPILDLASNRMTQFEVLVRMRGDNGELVPPGAFISTAERFGLISMLDQWVLRHSIRAFATAFDPARPTRMEVNVSGRSIGDAELMSTIEGELARSGLPPECLILELTETAAVADLDASAAFGRRLRELGIGFALDDFGAGFGSFSYLKRLPFDHLKIDGEFIQALPLNRTDQLMVEAVVGIARGMSKRTIAEFVEDRETLDLLGRYGVDMAQGFHVGRPVPFEEALALIDAGPSPETPVAEAGVT